MKPLLKIVRKKNGEFVVTTNKGTKHIAPIIFIAGEPLKSSISGLKASPKHRIFGSFNLSFLDNPPFLLLP